MKIAFGMPDTYAMGMSSLGLKVLYHCWNLRDDTVCERVFAPWPDMEARMREHGVPLYSLETFTPSVGVSDACTTRRGARGAL